MNKTTQGEYSKGSKWLHWVVAILVLLMLSFGFFLDDLPESYQSTAFMVHKSLGITIFFLMCIRLFWIVHTGKPELPKTVVLWEKVLSKAVQVSMYVFLFAMPLAGWIMSVAADRVPVYFGLFKMPLYGIPVDKHLSHLMGKAHEIIAWILIALIVLHVAGALKHYFFNKDRVLQRMFPSNS